MSVLGVVRARLRTAAVGGPATAGVLTLVGSFVPLLTIRVPPFDPGSAELDPPPEETLSMSAWTAESEWHGDGPELSLLVPVAPNGYPLVVAALILFAAGAMSARDAVPGRIRTAAVVTAAGAALLAGAAWAVAAEMLGFARMFGLGTEFAAPMSIGPGVWLVGAAVVLALAAAVAAWLRTREPEPLPDDAPTPPLGILAATPDHAGAHGHAGTSSHASTPDRASTFGRAGAPGHAGIPDTGTPEHAGIPDCASTSGHAGALEPPVESGDPPAAPERS